MGFLKRLTQSLFGSSRLSAGRRKTAKKVRKISRVRPMRVTGIKRKGGALRPSKPKKGGKRPQRLKNRKPKRTGLKRSPGRRLVRKRKLIKRAVPVKRAKFGPKKKTEFAGTEIAEVTHYFSRIGVAVLKLSAGELRVMDPMRFKGHTTDFKQTAASMQINRKPIEKAVSGDEIGLKVRKRVRAGDKVYRLN